MPKKSNKYKAKKWSKISYTQKFRNKSRNFDDPAYLQWRKDIYKRDGHKCQWPGCKRFRSRIHAHHILKWAKFPGSRFDVNNGICLCTKHHKTVTGQEEHYVKFFMDILRQNKMKKDEHNS